MLQPVSISFDRVLMVNRLTAPIDGKASPLKPKVLILSRLSVGNFEVAWRSTASTRSRFDIPQPLSVTLIKVRPPLRMIISILVAPASIEFSTNSLTALAGRSITSPAAILLIRSFGKSLIPYSSIASEIVSVDNIWGHI